MPGLRTIEPLPSSNRNVQFRPATFGNLPDLQMGIDELDWHGPWRPLATGFDDCVARRMTLGHGTVSDAATPGWQTSRCFDGRLW